MVHLETHRNGDDDLVVQLVVRNPEFSYRPGQYAEINIPEVSKSEWHPFTIASAPCDAADDDEYGHVEFFVKSVGKWTDALYRCAEDRTNVISEIGLRGPFGAPAQNYFEYDHLVVIGSGIGVTPLLSIWKHIVCQTRKLDVESENGASRSGWSTMSTGDMEEPLLHGGDCVTSSRRRALSTREREERLLDSFREHPGHVDVVAFEGRTLETFRARAAYFASVLESMTVNVSLFCFALLMETIVVLLYLFDQVAVPAAPAVHIVSSSLIVFIIGGKVVLSLIAYRRQYLCASVCMLEVALVLLDIGALIVSVDSIARNSVENRSVHFTLFGCYVFLHMLRMMYIFYASARPPKTSEPKSETGPGIKSVDGIWVSRNYSGMSFAAQDLVDSVNGLPSNFSLQLYATRDNKEAVEEADPFRGCDDRYALIAGRPDWESILGKALDRCYEDGGDAVGVFFCGSPGISATLQLVAHRLNSEHFYATRGRSPCRLLVHKENF